MEFEVELASDSLITLIQRGLSLNMVVPLTEAAIAQERALKTRMIQEVQANGQPYAPLRPSTLAQKKSGTILRETARLINAFQTSVSNNEAKIENPTEYGVYLQKGTYKMKARPFVEFSEDDKRRIERTMENYIQRQLGS